MRPASAVEQHHAEWPDRPTPITRSALPEIRTDDGIGRLSFILAMSGALIIGLAARRAP
jgi:hypothetical protein